MGDRKGETLIFLVYTRVSLEYFLIKHLLPLWWLIQFSELWMAKTNPPVANTSNTFLFPSSRFVFPRRHLYFFLQNKNHNPYLFFPSCHKHFLMLSDFLGKHGACNSCMILYHGDEPQFTESSFYHWQRIASNLGSTWKIISFEFLIFQMRKLHPLKLAICPSMASWSEARLGPGTPRAWSLLLLASHAASWASARHFLEPNCRALPTFFLNYIL